MKLLLIFAALLIVSLSAKQTKCLDPPCFDFEVKDTDDHVASLRDEGLDVVVGTLIAEGKSSEEDDHVLTKTLSVYSVERYAKKTYHFDCILENSQGRYFESIFDVTETEAEAEDDQTEKDEQKGDDDDSGSDSKDRKLGWDISAGAGIKIGGNEIGAGVAIGSHGIGIGLTLEI